MSPKSQPSRCPAPAPSSRFLRWRDHIIILACCALFFGAFFAPVTFSGGILAPGDGRSYYLPHFEMPLSLWNPDSMTGYPDPADPQEMKWYAPAFLLSRIPGSWNVFVSLGYVLASWFMYLYVRTLTGERFAGIAAGLFFGVSGFLMAHLGHITMIHAAAWTPCLLWVFEELWCAVRVRWVLAGAVAASQCILAGHPQIALYGLALASSYALCRLLSLRQGRIRYAFAVASAMALAMMLSSIQTFSTMVLSQLTPRVRMSFAEFGHYSVEPYQLPALLFPCLFGGAGAFILDRVPDLTASGMTETAGYVGFSGLVLAAIGVISRRRELVALFWAAVAMLSLAASMGTSTFLGRIVYLLPGFGQFRAQGRFMFVFCLSIAVLAALGISAIRRGPRSVWNPALVITALIALVATALLIEPLTGEGLRKLAAAHGIANFPVSVWTNRWIMIPVASAIAITILLLAFIRQPASLWRCLALLAGIIFELGTFGWYTEWRAASPRATDFEAPQIATNYIQKLHETNGRWLATRGYLSTPREMPPDLAALWGIAGIGKYGPLLPLRYRDLLEIETNGLMLGNWWTSRNRALDITAVRLVAVAPEQPLRTELFKGSAFASGDLNLAVGHGCGAFATESTIALQRPRRAAAIGIVSLMGCSTSIAQGTPVVEMTFAETRGTTVNSVLRAGIDTAEWAAACADVVSTMRHKPAEVFSRFAVPRDRGVCQGQQYVTFVRLPKSIEIQSMSLRWLPAGDGIVRLASVVFLDEKGTSDQLTATDVRVGDASRWKKFHEDAEFTVYENLRAMPRAWLVPETVTLTPAEVKLAIQTSKLPDGRDYDPATMALIETPLGFRSPERDPNARVWIVNDRKTAVDLQTFNRQPEFLVLGDLYYPGWTATVNGRPTRIVQTNYIQRGLLIPAGQNLIRFEFHPTAFYAGAGVTGSGVLFSLMIVITARRRGLL